MMNQQNAESMLMEEDVERILISQEEIEAKVSEIAKEMDAVYKNLKEDIVMVCILKGSVNFFSSLVQHLSFPVIYDFMCISSYGGSTNSSFNVNIIKDLSVNIEGKHVVIIEDILDTGNTLNALLKRLESRKPASLRLCCLLDKPERRLKPISVDFVGFSIPNEFVVGFGLDYNEYYRQLPYIGILKPEVYEK